MACYHPWQRDRADGVRLRLPCGQCIGCRLERSRQWAVRMMHEASLYEANCFITLTYDDGHLPSNGSLDRKAFPGFIRALRKRGVSARYFHCGEYGELGRPHYHAALFGYDFPDKVPWTTRNGSEVFRSALLEDTWCLGITEIGSLTFESAAYVARYCVKKVTGKRAASHYERMNPLTGEVYNVEPEFATMSRRPGIGAGWLEKYGGEVYPADEVIVRGRSCKPPRYYDVKATDSSPELLKEVVFSRALARRYQDASSARLHVREVCTEARMKLSPRRLA